MVAESQPQPNLDRAKNLVEVFEDTAARCGARAAATFKQGGVWREVSWVDMARRVRDVSDGLTSWGVGRGDRVSLLAETQSDWVIVDLGIMGAGAVTVPIYTSNPAHDCGYVLDHSGASWIFVDGEAQATKIRQVRERLPNLKGMIRFTGQPHDGFERTLADLEAAGAAWRKAHPQAHNERLAAIGLDDPATYIYTSGTTGKPKGVVLTHRAWVSQARAVAEMNLINANDVALMFLPLAHSFAKTCEAGNLAVGCLTAYVESIDKIVDNAGEVHPTMMPSVPRVFEKAYNTVMAAGFRAPGLKGKLFKIAMDGFDDWVASKLAGNERKSFGYRLGQRLVFPKLGKALAERFGGRMRLFVSGGAPLSPKISYFLEQAGFMVLEGWGLTEASGGSTVNRPGRNHIGTVGPAFPATEIRVAEDGEVLLKSPNVMQGYHKDPAATQEVLRDGWLYTGDIGELTADGCLRITDRKKDIIVTAGGKNVAPQNLENELKTDPLISNVMVHGDKRRFISALITLDDEAVQEWAQAHGITLTGELANHPEVRARIQQTIDAVNAKQASYTSIKKFAILPKDFSQEAGELTPTLKVKRKFCSEKYKEILDEFYAE